MKRSKRDIIKQELPETSTAQLANQKQHDLAYYIHDRVELMHQVFAMLKPKELKAMAPDCVRHISIRDLQELCMEELLGISSKRLCAILDGATPPSDTESSSESEHLETISLDSISSDEEILSQVSSKKIKKHKHRSKSRNKKRKCKDRDDKDKDQADRSRRTGLTVLELLELQARARAIRAQLQQEQASAAVKREDAQCKVSTDRPSESVTGNSTDDEVEIKEEAAEVVEISSEDEKPKIEELEERIAAIRKDATSDANSNSKTVTKKVNDLIITVPKTNTSRKIKLRRKNKVNSEPADDTQENKKKSAKTANSVVIVQGTGATNAKKQELEINTQILPIKSRVVTQTSLSKGERTILVNIKDKNKSKDKKKKRKKDKQHDKDGSDHDEIMLQLSDTEKMDLLEDLDGNVSKNCSDTADSSCDSSDEDSAKENDRDEDKNTESNNVNIQKTNLGNDFVDIQDSKENEINLEPVTVEKSASSDSQYNGVESVVNKTPSELEVQTDIVDKEIIESDTVTNNDQVDETQLTEKDNSSLGILKGLTDSEKGEIDDSSKNLVETSCFPNSVLVTLDVDTTLNVEENIQDAEKEQCENIVNNEKQSVEVGEVFNNEKVTEVNKGINVTDEILEHSTNNKVLTNLKLTDIDEVSNNEANDANGDDFKEKSEGELSDRDSSEVEASDFKLDVVCISDDEEKKERKKKNKKGKKKKSKKKDFRESADQNFYSERNKNVPNKPNTEHDENYDCGSNCDSAMIENSQEMIKTTEADVVELKDIITVPDMESSKPDIVNRDIDFEDNVFETLELSDDSSCYEVEEISISKEPTADEIEALSAKFDELERERATDCETAGWQGSEELDNVSWKDRYLQSSKVKKVLSTASIMNAMRKKNLELKKKLQQRKNEVEIKKQETNYVEITNTFEEGSIEQYNTLEISTKYVDPVKDVTENTDNVQEIENAIAAKVIDGNEAENNGRSVKDTVTNDLKKQAKQLLKMYKKLMKYNNIYEQSDPNKKRKKKKKSKDKDKTIDGTSVTI